MGEGFGVGEVMSAPIISESELAMAVGAFGTTMVLNGYILPLDEDGDMLRAVEDGISAKIKTIQRNRQNIASPNKIKAMHSNAIIEESRAAELPPGVSSMAKPSL